MPSSNGASHIVQDTVKPVMICQQCKDVRATTLVVVLLPFQTLYL